MGQMYLQDCGHQDMFGGGKDNYIKKRNSLNKGHPE
jgi:hypothetical protein